MDEVTGAVQCPRAPRCDGMGKRRRGGEKLKATSAGVRTFASPIDWRFGGMAPSFHPPRRTEKQSGYRIF